MQNKQTIVDDHRNMLMLTKNISDFQENNLKSWAFVFFKNVKAVKVSWNFFKKNKNKDFYPGKVVFDIYFQKGHVIDADGWDRCIDQLTAATKFLFWSETDVAIKINGKTWQTK